MWLIVLLLIVAAVAYVYVKIKINNVAYRAKQSILKDTPLSASNLSATTMGMYEKGAMQKCLQEHPDYTEEQIKGIVEGYAQRLAMGYDSNCFSDKVKEKMVNDKKLEAIRNKLISRSTMTYYKNNVATIIAVFNVDNKDEVNLHLNCSFVDGKIILDSYTIMKGAVLGL